MAVPSVILDGTMPYGTGSAITINSVSYIITDEEITPEWAEAMDNAATGYPGRARYTKQRYKWSATLQLATSGTAFPPPGSTFTRTVQNEATAITFVVLETPYSATNAPGDIRTAKVTGRQVINSITTA
tara:strand:- start:679 stop:1065 length:387 start_codon:yes stop_codon:yes gene_type:complete